MRRIVKGAAASAALGVVLALLPVLGASAEGVPPSALPSCNDPLAAGGWVLRDFTARGTKVDTWDNVPVRPRTARLGEPCLSSGKITVPIALGEVNFEAYDPNDVTNQATAGTAGRCSIAYNITNSWPDNMDTGAMNCDQAALAFTSGSSTFTSVPGVPTTQLAAVAAGRVLTVTIPTFTTGTDARGAAIHVFCRATNGNPPGSGLTHPTTTLSWTTTAPPTTQTITCPVGEAPHSAVWAVRDNASWPSGVSGKTTSSRSWGTFWRADAVALQGNPATVLGYQASYSTYGDGVNYGAAPGYLVCSTTRNGATSQLPITERLVSGDVALGADEPGELPTASGTVWDRVTNFIPSNGATVTTCPYLHEIAFPVCVWVGYGLEARTCVTTSWTYAKWLQHDDYDQWTPDQELCGGELPFNETVCNPILYPDYQDYSLFAVACANPPPMVWLDFAWIPDTIGHYFNCLIVPQGGWDSDGKIAEAYETSAAAEVVIVIESLGDSFTFGETCGVILTVPLHGELVVIDTCSWGFASQVKTFIAAVMLLGFGFWAVRFLSRILTSFFDRSKMPNPLGEEE